MTSVNEELQKLFQAHGVEAILQDDWLVFPGRSLKANAVLVGETAHEAVVTVQLDVHLQNTSGRTIVESFAGVGATAAQASADALQNFVANAFHVMLAAFFGIGGDQVTVEKWKVENKPYRVTIGSVGVRGEPPVQGETLVAWCQPFAEKLKQHPFPPGTHWVRVFYAQIGGETLACEVLLNNEVWDEMQTEMAATDWPAGEAFYSLRHFVVLQVKKAKG